MAIIILEPFLPPGVSLDQLIRITGRNKWFGTLHVLRDIDLTVTRQERIV